MPCTKCDHLRKEYESALVRLRSALARLELQELPTQAQLDRVERHRASFEQVRKELEDHVVFHSPEE